ncbi:MAG: metal ABC transporter permease [Rhizobiales bacterium]|nr:metal ABC transporter permease [Hyphomicrobiales bacterium]
MLDILFEPFFRRALLAGLAVALVAGPIGCFIVWRRMAYFGETLAHAGLLGAGLGLLFNVNIAITAVVVAMILALILIALRRQQQLAVDTILGILSHTALALGVVVIGLVTGAVTGHLDILFGDVLTVSSRDVWTVWIVAAAALLLLATLWRRMIAISVHEDLARAEGINVQLVELLFTLLIAFVVAISMKIVGLLLITALTVIPAAAARRLSATPESMAVLSVVLAAAAVLAGLFMSAAWGTVAGPSIVLSAGLLFVLTLPLGQRS